MAINRTNTASKGNPKGFRTKSNRVRVKTPVVPDVAIPAKIEAIIIIKKLDKFKDVLYNWAIKTEDMAK
jgi:hypothetical protein